MKHLLTVQIENDGELDECVEHLAEKFGHVDIRQLPEDDETAYVTAREYGGGTHVVTDRDGNPIPVGGIVHTVEEWGWGHANEPLRVTGATTGAAYDSLAVQTARGSTTGIDSTKVVLADSREARLRFEIALTQLRLNQLEESRRAAEVSHAAITAALARLETDLEEEVAF